MVLVDVDAEVEKGVDPTPPVAISLPSIHTDPFATREGKTLTWKNINMTLVRL